MRLPALLVLLGCIGGWGSTEAPPVDDYEMGLRYEVLGIHRDALAFYRRAAAGGTPAGPAIERLERLQRCASRAGGNPFLPPGCSSGEVGGGTQLEGGLTVESVAWGSCGALLSAPEGAAVGQRFWRSRVAGTEPVLNTPDDIDEVVLDGCEKGGHRGAKLWHILHVSSREGLWEGMEPLSWNEGDDPFVIARLFGKYNDLKDDRTLRPIFALIAQRHAALRNATLAEDPPPWDLPGHLVEEFTMGGRVEVARHYVDESTGGARANYEFGSYGKGRAEIEAMVAAAGRREARYYADADAHLYEAILAIGGLEGKSVVVMGSLEPWYEAVCLAHSAASCTTIEYNPLSYDHPGIATLTVAEYEALPAPPRFDVALSVSSFEHDGLGRYGDPVDPGGDLAAMRRMAGVLREGGVMLLAVPVGRDLVKWNAHRKYGRVRLPVLFQGWTIVGQVGLTEAMLDDPGVATHAQPVWVLRNERPTSDGIDWGSLLAGPGAR